MNSRLIVISLIVALSLLAASPALADDGEHCDNPADFGQHHADMAQAGMIGQEMNPGMHQGRSNCVP